MLAWGWCGWPCCRRLTVLVHVLVLLSRAAAGCLCSFTYCTPSVKIHCVPCAQL